MTTTRSFIFLSLLSVFASSGDGRAAAAVSDLVGARSLQEDDATVEIPADCLDLLAASANEYGKLKKENYFVFTDGMSNGYFSSNDVRSYDGLPSQNKFGFVTLACACRDRGARSNCCQGNRARLDVAGIDDPETMPARTRAYVMDICSVTSEAIGDNKLPPTGELPATTTAPPTKSPTSAFAFAAAVSSRSTEEGNDRGGIPGIAWLGVAVAGAFLFALFLYHLYGEDKQVEAREVRPATAVWMDKMHETATRIAEGRRANAERRREERERKLARTVVADGERDEDGRPPPASPDETASVTVGDENPVPSARTAPGSGWRATLGRMLPPSTQRDRRSSAVHYPDGPYLPEGRDGPSDDDEDSIEEGDATRRARSNEPNRIERIVEDEEYWDAVSRRAAANWGMRPTGARRTSLSPEHDGGRNDELSGTRPAGERRTSPSGRGEFFREMSERQESLRSFLQS